VRSPVRSPPSPNSDEDLWTPNDGVSVASSFAVAPDQEQQQRYADFMTPIRTPPPPSSSTKSPRFVFLSDQKAVPEQLDRLQEKSVRTRQEFLGRIHDLECQAAAVTARVAEESMARDQQMRGIVEACAHRPLEKVVERLERSQASWSLDGDGQKRNWMELERRLAVLDSRMAKSVHVTLQDLQRRELHPLQARVESRLEPDTKRLISQSLRQEGGAVSRFESLAGSMARRYSEERASRIAALELASLKIRTYQEIDTKRADEFIEQIRSLRSRVAAERAERKSHDDQLRRRIDQATASLKRSLFDLAAGGNGGGGGSLLVDDGRELSPISSPVAEPNTTM